MPTTQHGKGYCDNDHVTPEWLPCGCGRECACMGWHYCELHGRTKCQADIDAAIEAVCSENDRLCQQNTLLKAEMARLVLVDERSWKCAARAHAERQIERRLFDISPGQPWSDERRDIKRQRARLTYGARLLPDDDDPIPVEDEG